jgi:hypothetical protein
MKQETLKDRSSEIIHLEFETLKQIKAPFAQCRLLRQRKRRQVNRFRFGPLANHASLPGARAKEITLTLGFVHA